MLEQIGSISNVHMSERALQIGNKIFDIETGRTHEAVSSLSMGGSEILETRHVAKSDFTLSLTWN